MFLYNVNHPFKKHLLCTRDRHRGYEDEYKLLALFNKVMLCNFDFPNEKVYRRRVYEIACLMGMHSGKRKEMKCTKSKYSNTL